MDSDSADVIISNMSRNIKFDYWLNESAKDITFEDAFEVDAEIEWYAFYYKATNNFSTNSFNVGFILNLKVALLVESLNAIRSEIPAFQFALKSYKKTYALSALNQPLHRDKFYSFLNFNLFFSAR